MTKKKVTKDRKIAILFVGKSLQQKRNVKKVDILKITE